MSYSHPRYGLVSPDNQTKAKDLGAELKAMGASIVNALDQFDYDGADPNLVLARLASIEAKKYQQGEAAYPAVDGGSASGWTWTNEFTIPFPTAYPIGSTPIVTLNSINGGHLQFAMLASVTNTGFTARIVRLAGAPIARLVHWRASLA